MRIRSSIIFLCVWLLTTAGWSCQVPVFRYALERWDAEQYRLVVMHRTPLDAEMQKQLLSLQENLSSKQPTVNLTLEVVDVTKVAEEARWSLPDIKAMKSDHWIVLVSPKGNEPVHSEALTKESLSRVLDSPARKAWVKQIVGGASVVWIIIPGKDENETKEVRGKLETILTKAAKEITIPEGVIKPEEVKDVTGDIDLEDVLRSPIPLKIHFPTMVLDRNDPAEAVFVSMLMQGIPEEMRDQAVIVPVFGRGRILQPLPASRMTEQLILGGCNYLCGACSCQVKDQNPGVDIVIQEDWSKHLTGGLVVVEKELPPLEGVGDLAKQEKPADETSEPNTTQTLSTTSQPNNLLYVGGGILVLLRSVGSNTPPLAAI